MPRQLLKRHAWAGCCERHDRLAFDVNARHNRLIDGFGKVGADFIHRVFDIVQGPGRIDFELEFNRGCRGTVGDGRDDMLDAGDIGDRVFDFARDLRFKFGRCCAALRNADQNDRNIDVWKLGNRQPHEA